MTPKTLDKYIAALKKKAAAEGWTSDEYLAELDKIKNEMAQQYLDDKITTAEYTKVTKQLDNATKNPGLQGKNSGGSHAPGPSAAQASTAGGMTSDELKKIQAGVMSKVISGEISKGDGEKLMDMLADSKDGGMSQADAEKQLQNALLLMKLHGFSADDAISSAKSVAWSNQTAKAQQGMTHDEYIGMWEALNKKKKAGLITADEYSELGSKLDKAYHDKKTVSEIEKEIGCDPGTLATDESVIRLGKEFKKVYGQAAKEMQAELDKFLAKYKPEMDELNQKLLDGTFTPEEFKRLKMLMLQQKTIQQKIEQLAGTMTQANQKAMKLINGEMLNVFAENANYQSYALSQDTKMNLMFSVYDEHTAAKLLKDKPELLPRKEVKGKKDKAWNQKIIANAVLQGVIQGDSIPKLAKRIAVQTGETNMKAMIRYARTAMTSAQNSGRMEMLHKAKGMGIQCKKVWLATLDSRTRDAHAKMDGQTADVDDDFMSDFGPIKFPGDLSSKGSVPANLYNCRCTLIYDYEGFPNDPTEDQRLMYEEWDETVPVKKKDKNGKEYEAQKTIHHRESKLIQDMSYGEWKAAKEHDKLNDLNAAKYQLAEAQKAVVKAKIKEDKIYEGLWKDPVTLADYPAKKGGIQAKMDYYDAEIAKYKQAQAEGKAWATDDKIKELEKKRKLLKEFEQRGQLIEKRDAALANVQGIYNSVGFQKTAAAPAVAKQTAAKKAKKAAGSSSGADASTQTQSTGTSGTPFGPDAYTQDRKDAARWTTDKGKVDAAMRSTAGQVWQGASKLEKDAAYDYTTSYSKFNEPLRGIEYGTSRYLGVGHTDLDAGYKHNGAQLDAFTDLIDRSVSDHDMWMQRGCRTGGMDKFFQISERLLTHGSEQELQQALLGKTVTEYGFMSCGSAKGQGFTGMPVMLYIYAPKGTKMLYAEPFSAYGNGSGRSWDGKSKQTSYGHEFETILQQGTQFRVSRVRKVGGTLVVDLEVIDQSHQQRWKKK